jgi:hypothetical protein
VGAEDPRVDRTLGGEVVDAELEEPCEVDGLVGTGGIDDVAEPGGDVRIAPEGAEDQARDDLVVARRGEDPTTDALDGVGVGKKPGQILVVVDVGAIEDAGDGGVVRRIGDRERGVRTGELVDVGEPQRLMAAPAKVAGRRGGVGEQAPGGGAGEVYRGSSDGGGEVRAELGVARVGVGEQYRGPAAQGRGRGLKDTLKGAVDRRGGVVVGPGVAEEVERLLTDPGGLDAGAGPEAVGLVGPMRVVGVVLGGEVGDRGGDRRGGERGGTVDAVRAEAIEDARA